ncbi:MAG: hypothetical protein ACOYBT_09990 [Polynucleobacter sp.]
MGRARGKLSKGQPKGSRSASGRKRDRTQESLTPCIGVARRRELYRLPANDVGEASAEERRKRRGRLETDTCDALGRAYIAGLLGAGEHAERRLLAGRKIAAQYWRVLGFPTLDSLARFQPQHPSQPMDPKLERIREDALNIALDMVRARGRDVRRCFDQLVIDPNPDHGPLWLDTIVWAYRQHRTPTERDQTSLSLALEGLDAIA